MRAATLNISHGGMCIKLQSFGSIETGTVVAIRMQDFPLIEGRVIWVNTRVIGVEFIDNAENPSEFADLLDRLGHGRSFGSARPGPTKKGTGVGNPAPEAHRDREGPDDTP